MRNLLVLAAATLAAVILSASAATAASVPKCAGTYSQQTLYTDQDLLESVTVGNQGRLYVSAKDDELGKAVLRRYPAPGSPPELVSVGDSGPGGLAWDRKSLLWGYGNTYENGSTGDENPKAGLYRVNPATGDRTVVSSTLGMANGIARSREGFIYASNDLGLKLDRISPGGLTIHGWATVDSGNGIVIGKNGKYLYINQTFTTPGAIARIELANPANVTTYFSSAGLDPPLPIFDGLTRDDENNLYAAVWATGEIWKINRSRQACVVATDIGNISSLAFGKGKKGFSKGRLYAVGFFGQIVQVKGALNATVPAT